MAANRNVNHQKAKSQIRPGAYGFGSGGSETNRKAQGGNKRHSAANETNNKDPSAQDQSKQVEPLSCQTRKPRRLEKVAADMPN